MPDPTVPTPEREHLARLHRLVDDLAVELDAIDNAAAELTDPVAERVARLLAGVRDLVGQVVDDVERAAAGLPLAPDSRRVLDAAVDVARGLAAVDDLVDLPVDAQAAWARQCRPVLGVLVDELVPQPPTGPTIARGDELDEGGAGR